MYIRNLNPSPYLTRFSGTKQFPSCANHVAMFDYTDMMEFMYYMEMNPHATVHGTVGGPFGCDMLIPLLNVGYINSESDLRSICSAWIFTLKGLYRSNLISPSKCSLDLTDVERGSVEERTRTQEAFCPFICNTDMEGFESTLIQQLEGYGVLSKDDADEKAQTAWINFICGGDASRMFSG